MKSLKYTFFILLTSLFVMSSCSSSKSVTKSPEKNTGTFKSSPELATATKAETTVSATDAEKINYFAENMAVLYCEIVQLNKNYKASGNQTILTQINEKELQLANLNEQASKAFVTDGQKNELNNAYLRMIEKCK